MKGDETRKTKQNNKTWILEKLKESIISEEVEDFLSRRLVKKCGKS